LICDQDHVDRVLASFANSPFRFVLNQLVMNRYPLTVRPQLSLEKAERLPPRPGALPKTATLGGSEEEAEANVELVLYGTMTLYQRFPPRDLPKPAADQPK
jgi:hypothetical protein